MGFNDQWIGTGVRPGKGPGAGADTAPVKSAGAGAGGTDVNAYAAGAVYGLDDKPLATVFAQQKGQGDLVLDSLLDIVDAVWIDGGTGRTKKESS